MFFYLLSILIAPFVRVLTYYRSVKGLEDKSRIRERYGHASLQRQPGSLIWVHAASVGETISIIPLIKAYKKAYPKQTILLTTTTVTACAIVKQRLSGFCLHQYVPFDIGPWVDRFLKYWKPSLAIFVESELWPNLIQRLYKSKIPLILLNARLSDRSYKRWLKFPAVAKFLLTRFNLCLAQSPTTAERLKILGAKNVEVMANLKFAAESLPFNEEKLKKLKSMFEDRLIWVVTSTHAGEEEIALRVHHKVKRDFPNLLTLLIPRHPQRVEKVEKICDGLELSFARHSEEPKNANYDVYLGDTIGELGLFFTLGRIVFMGGSFVPIGGHNPIEPAMMGCAVIWGPYMHNFRDVCATLSEACWGVETEEELEERLRFLLQHSEKVTENGKRAAEIVASQAESLQNIIATLRSYCRNE